MFLKRKPRLHDGTVMVNMDNNRLVAVMNHQLSD